jgi:hypothetical protein
VTVVVVGIGVVVVVTVVVVGGLQTAHIPHSSKSSTPHSTHFEQLAVLRVCESNRQTANNTISALSV